MKSICHRLWILALLGVLFFPVFAYSQTSNEYYLRGFDEHRNGNYDQAIILFTKALELNNENRDAYFNRGLSYLRQDKYPQAISDFTQGIGMNSENEGAYYSRGLAYRGQGDNVQAIADFTKVIEMNPKMAGAYYSRGVAHSSLGDPDRAIADFAQAIAVDPAMAMDVNSNLARAYYFRGTIFDEQSDFPQAISDYSKSLEINPDQEGAAGAYNNRAIDYFLLKDYDKAWEDVRKVEQLGDAVHPDFLKALQEASGQKYNAQIALANAQEQKTDSHLDKYPGIEGKFAWGMSVKDIEGGLNQSLSNLGQSKYQAKFTSGGLELDATFIVPADGLEALILRFDISPDKFYELLDKLRALYGEPSAVDTGKAAMQWKDNLNDTGILIAGEREGLYSVITGLRILRNKNIVTAGLDPGKVSSLEGIKLGMSKEDFLDQYKHFSIKEFPHEEGIPKDAEIYQGSLTFNLHPSEALFEFNQNKLTYITVPLFLESQEEDYINKAFNDHLGFLSDLYGRPSDEAVRMVAWSDGASELRLGLHPFGTMFVVSWEALP